MRLPTRSAFYLVLLAGCGGAKAATVDVTVQGVQNANGHILVALCTKAEFLHPHCAWRGRAVAAVGDVHVTIADVPPGVYAAQAFHDENDNGRLDRNMLGLPREAMGFSNNAPMRMGPPRFDAAAFEVTLPVTGIVFRLRYF
jgi:uncharacterized protein (DUF2141 family)